MTAKTSQTQAGRNDDIEARVSLLEYQFAEVLKKLDRIESKQDAAIRQIDTLKYVGQHEYDQFVKTTESRLNKVDTIKNRVALVEKIIFSLVGLVLILVLTAVVTGVLKP